MKLNSMIAVARRIAPAFFVLCLAVSAVAQDDDEPIRVDSQLVVINATVTGTDGKPAVGLKQSQFEVLEDGKPQRIEFFLSEETPFAAVILLDTSGSMEERVSMARSAAIEFLGGLRTDDVAAIYNFDSKVSQVQDFSSARYLVDGFFDLKSNGMTVLNDAVLAGAKALQDRPEKRRAIIILSDGADTRSSASSDKALRAALAANAVIYTVDMSAIDDNSRGRMQNRSVLKNFAEKSGGRFVATPGGRALSDAFKKIVAELGIQYTIGYVPANESKDGKWREIEVKTKREGLTVRSRKGYFAPKSKK